MEDGADEEAEVILLPLVMVCGDNMATTTRPCMEVGVQRGEVDAHPGLTEVLAEVLAKPRTPPSLPDSHYTRPRMVSQQMSWSQQRCTVWEGY